MRANSNGRNMKRNAIVIAKEIKREHHPHTYMTGRIKREKFISSNLIEIDAYFVHFLRTYFNHIQKATLNWRKKTLCSAFYLCYRSSFHTKSVHCLGFGLGYRPNLCFYFALNSMWQMLCNLSGIFRWMAGEIYNQHWTQWPERWARTIWNQ